MSGETKSLGRKDKLDRFYTPSNIVNQCLQLLNLNEYDCIIEPSAGMGSFSEKIPNCISYDIAPEKDYIIQQDWFTLDKTNFKQYNNILVVGNPPFGEQNSLAIRFFNESARFCNAIAFILPLSFKKDSIQNQLNLNFYLEKELLLNNCNFYLKNQEELTVPCVFQVWIKHNSPRKKKRLKTTSTLFSYVKKEEADFRVQRVGGNAGKASFDLNRAVSSNYFIKNNSDKTNEEFVDYINHLTFPTIEFTVGPKSLSKGEMVAVIEDNWI